MKNVSEKKKHTPLIAIIVVVIVLALVGTVGFQFRELIFPDFFSEEEEENAGKEESVEKKNKKSGYDLNPYMVFEFDGYDYAGSVKVSFDKKNFLIDYEDKLEKKTKKMDIEIDEYVDDVIIPNLTYSIDKSNGLSNGDKVHLTWKLDREKVQEKYDIILNVEDFDVEVKGLKEPKEFDPFEDVEVVFSGKAPWGSADINYKNDNDLFYVFSATDNLKNGDTISVEVEYQGHEINDYIAEYHKIPSVLKKEYVVSGLQEIITSTDEIPVELIESLDDKMQKTAKVDFAVRSEEELVSMDLLGYYFMVASNKDSAHDNVLTLVYRNEVKVTPENTDISAYLYYYSTVSFFDIQKDVSGDITCNSTNYEIPDQELIKNVRILLNEDKSYYYKGFESVESIVKSSINSFANDYEITYKELMKDNFKLLDNIEQINDEFIVEAANYVASAYKLYVNTFSSEYLKVNDISYMGHYYAQSKYENKNAVVFVFKVDIYEKKAPTVGHIENQSYCFSMRWNNVGFDGEKFIYEKYCNQISDELRTKLNNYKIYGYETYDDLYDNEILPLTNDYNVEIYMKE